MVGGWLAENGAGFLNVCRRSFDFRERLQFFCGDRYDDEVVRYSFIRSNSLEDLV